ncbi:hypothetical protein LCGC14_2153460 [marine sediment metagenome]|uniref:Uncharacterized protein n=1 Tax=marine sediment metagenome TaxID=412755 RepID=A0A0F9DV18_9ZZZZ
MRFKVFKVTTEGHGIQQGMKTAREYQLEAADVDAAVDYILVNVPHQVSQAGTDMRADSYGVHLTKWLCLDKKDYYWFIPGGRFRKQPTPIEVKDESKV